MRKFLILLLTILAIVLFAKERIVVNSYMSDPAPRAALAELVKMFEEKYPQYEVVVNTFAHEDFKVLLRTWLASPKGTADVVTWFAGERMRYFAEMGLLYPVDEVFEGSSWSDYFPESFKSTCSYKDKIYFIPQSWYWWGVYYRKSIFEKYGIKAPKTWDEFLAVCETLKSKGITPIAIGTKFPWTAAGWFDILNLRINGLDFHIDLTAGKVPYNDPRIKKVFEYWRQIIDKGYYLANHSAYEWQEAATFLFRGEAAMYYMGQFIKDVAPAEVKDDLDFFRFPTIDPSVGLYEETPIDGFMIPANAPNKKGAIEFLKFIASKEAQEKFAKDLGRLAANVHVAPPDEHAKKGLQMILESHGVAQFYDRDTNPEMAEVGMNAMIEFMLNPGKISSILDRLESERKRIYGVK
ncbi:ABC transporter substrate-binding protein [Pseudothermotoga thermarum]|uniref:Carbohydrate ABC transporter substrate-binding protein, CUT1 family n=1 Tax=Pseudothermotoga thermarum DSM 5069 TaxID=688269 RepID=F7YUH7_9THEM|nr:ABC transporter substrate-binding protein [Pseudothermotoga thermarum]AEH51448.1 carbohydrate ABC transporter substrate-binding protein, CUT1 family [Pseudothermotoga thermarum DSM 5069]